MFASLSQRDKNLLYAFAALLAIYVLYKYVWLNQIDYYDKAKAEYQILSTKVIEYRNTVDQLNKLKNQDKLLENKLQVVIQPFNVDINGGQHMQIIGSIIENAGLKVINTTPVAIEVYDNYYAQNINFKIQGTYGGLQQFFYDLENTKTYFDVSKIDIYPLLNEGIDPQFASLNYNNLTTDLVVRVIGDKGSKATKPKNSLEKLDLFKPTETGINKMLQLKKEIELQATSNSSTAVTSNPQINITQPTATVAPTNYNQPTTSKPKVITTKVNKPDEINYDFEKR